MNKRIAGQTSFVAFSTAALLQFLNLHNGFSFQEMNSRVSDIIRNFFLLGFGASITFSLGQLRTDIFKNTIESRFMAGGQKARILFAFNFKTN